MSVEDTLRDAFAIAPHPVAGILERLSPSSIEAFLKCPEQYRRDKWDPEPRPAHPDLIFGAAFHRAAEANFTQKIESHQDLPVGEVRDLAGDMFTAVVDEERDQRGIDWGDIKPAKVQAGVIESMVGTGSHPGYHQTLAPQVQPLAVERWFEVPTPLGLPLVGRVDVDTTAGLIDLKTARKAKTQLDLDKNVQATAYLWAKHQQAEEPLPFRWHTVIRTVKPQQQQLETSRAQPELDQFGRLLDVVADTMVGYAEQYGLEGPWPPTSPLAWWCSPGQCSYYGNGCPWRTR